MTNTSELSEENQLRQLALEAGLPELTDIQPIAGAGSNRRYYRLRLSPAGADNAPTVADNAPAVADNTPAVTGTSPVSCGDTAIGTFGDDRAENRAFVMLSHHFSSRGLPVPKILAVSEDFRCYIQSDVGNRSVFDLLAPSRKRGEYNGEDRATLRRAMQLLADIHVEGSRGLDFNICYPEAEMNRGMVERDLNYFKYCFLKPSGLEFDELALQKEFDALADKVMEICNGSATFMLRDFQSRNVMVGREGQLSIIDYQGGRRGPAQYDLASFLWQAAAAYPPALKRELTGCYLDARRAADSGFDRQKFMAGMPPIILLRILQTLGAYGFRGWVEHKPHFLNSISMGVGNLYSFIHDGSAAISDSSTDAANRNTGSTNMAQEFPLLASLSAQLRDKFGLEAREQFRHNIPAAKNPLTVVVKSFSYKKGIPADASGNGGGFVFDCRAPHNPGRYEPYKLLTGLDKPVRDFLEADGEIQPFIEGCKTLVEASVERYLQRGFTSLQVCFGCTGGQHRSVYCADAMARHLNEKYGVRIEWEHREQNLAGVLEARDADLCFDSFLKSPQKTYKAEATIQK